MTMSKVEYNARLAENIGPSVFYLRKKLFRWFSILKFGLSNAKCTCAWCSRWLKYLPGLRNYGKIRTFIGRWLHHKVTRRLFRCTLYNGCRMCNTCNVSYVIPTFKHNTLTGDYISYTKSHLVNENYMGIEKPTPVGKLTKTLCSKKYSFVVRKTVYFCSAGNNTHFTVCTCTEQKYRINDIFMT